MPEDEGNEVIFQTGDTEFQDGVQSNNYVRTTRYTLWSFIPLTLYENFQRFANIYFLIMAIFGFLPFSPISPFVQVSPLVIVIVVSMIKSGVEDYMRHTNDVRVNSVTFEVLDRKIKRFRKVKSMDIKPGDLIRIRCNQEIPSDVVVVETTGDDGVSYINEVNLNGETALKQKKCLFSNENFDLNTIAKVKVPAPNKDILKLDGSLEINNQPFPFSIKNCYLRGTVLMHTKWSLGIALYTGHDTRIIQNQRHAPNKTSRLDKRLNELVLADFIFNIVIVLILSLLSLKAEDDLGFSWIDKIKNAGTLFVQHFVAYAILLSYMIPISLYVTIEVVRFFQRWTFQLDMSMYEPDLGYAVVHNSNLNEELGMIDHIFSDKTGTLTENKMNLVDASIGDKTFDLRLPNDGLRADAQSGILSDLFRDIALCNSIVLTEDGYSSESPDEEALVLKAKDLGVIIKSKRNEVTTLRYGTMEEGADVEYKICATIDFTSARKRMSVIVRDKEGKLTLYSKGADSIMFSLLKEDQDITETQRRVDDFARMGLRTLVMCKKQITEEDYAAWKEQYDEAFVNIQNRDENVAKAGALIENDLELIGSVAIEDELQPEVGETIAFLSKMQINLWVLTGDKKETAVSIGKSTNVITDRNTIVYFDDPATIDQINTDIRTSENPVLVISPAALESVFDTNFLPDASVFCKNVICFRMSPNNKARVVETMKERTTKVCLAVGDGANDVSMIQSASVGIGIFGREGHQAASNSDFAITRFKHLRRLLAVHGRLSLVRISGVIIYMIAKNILLIFPQIWFCIFTAFTPTTVYNDFLLSTYNIVWTVLPPVIYGWFEQDVSPSSMMQKPMLYVEARAGRYSSWWRIGLELINVIYQSIIVFIFDYYLPSIVITDPKLIGGQYATQGLWMFIAVVLAADLQAALRSKHYNAYQFLGIYLSIFVLLLFTVGYGSFSSFAPEFYMVPQNTLTEYMPYLYILISVFICLLPEALFRFLKGLWFPSYTRIIREQELLVEKEKREQKIAQKVSAVKDWIQANIARGIETKK